MKVILADGTEKTVTVDKDSAVNTAASFGDGDLIKYASISDSNVMDVTSVTKDGTSDILTASASGNVYDKTPSPLHKRQIFLPMQFLPAMLFCL